MLLLFRKPEWTFFAAPTAREVGQTNGRIGWRHSLRYAYVAPAVTRTVTRGVPK